MAAMFSAVTPEYAGTAAQGAKVCGDPFAWLFGIFGIPTPAYEVAAPRGGTPGPAAQADADAKAKAEAGAAVLGETPAPIVLAPSGPVTIVLGADVTFAQP